MTQVILMIFASLLFVQNVSGEGIVLEEDPYIDEDAASLEDNFSGDEVSCPELPACRYFVKFCWSTKHNWYDFVIENCQKTCRLC